MFGDSLMFLSFSMVELQARLFSVVLLNIIFYYDYNDQKLLGFHWLAET